MSEINRNDLKIIASAAFQMANADAEIDVKEAALYKKIINAGSFSAQELQEIKVGATANLEEFVEQLSSAKAKKLLLLTVTSIALVNGTMGGGEKEILDKLSKKLNVGTVNLNDHTSESCEKMALKLIAEN